MWSGSDDSGRLSSFNAAELEETDVLTPHSTTNVDLDNVVLEGRSRIRLLQVVFWILVIQMMERVCFYTFFGTQPYYLEAVGYSTASAGAINNIMGMLCYLTPIFGGWLADTRLGRFYTIVVFSFIYLLGLGCATFAAWEPKHENSAIYSVGVLGLVALGTGGIKPCVFSFGADQYDTSLPKEAAAQESYFTYFYFSINMGALIAYGYLTTLATSGQPPAISQESGYFAAYLVAAGCMWIGVVFFICPCASYRASPPEGNALVSLFRYIVDAAKKNRKGRIVLGGWVLLILFLIISIVQAFLGSKILAFVCFGIGIAALLILIPGYLNTDFLDECEHFHSLSRSDAKDLLRIVPTLFSASIGFNLLYNPINYYNIQACQFNLHVGTQQISGSFFNIADYIAILVFTPVWESCASPFLGRFIGSEPTRNQRITVGFVFAALSNAIAAVLEVIRRSADLLPEYGFSHCAAKGIYMSDFSGFYMFIPFLLMGIGEVLINPVLVYFAAYQSPPAARNLAQSLFLLTMAVTNGLTAVMGIMMQQFITDNLNDGKMEIFYVLTIFSGLLCLPIFFFVSSVFEDKDFTTIQGSRRVNTTFRSLSGVGSPAFRYISAGFRS